MKKINFAFAVILTSSLVFNANPMTKITKTKTKTTTTTYVITDDYDSEDLGIEEKISSLTKCLDETCKKIYNFYIGSRDIGFESSTTLHKEYTSLVDTLIHKAKATKADVKKYTSLYNSSKLAPLFFTELNFAKKTEELSSMLKKLKVIKNMLDTVESRYELEKGIIAYDVYFPKRLNLWRNINIEKWTDQHIAVINFLKITEYDFDADMHRTMVAELIGKAIKMLVSDWTKAFSNNEIIMKSVFDNYAKALDKLFSVQTKYDKRKKEFYA